MKIVTIAEMQKAERDSAQYGISLSQLMENAGKAVAEETRRILGNLSLQNILILVGPGNNGGDGLVAARYLFDWGAVRTKVLSCGKRPAEDVNLDAVLKRGIPYKELESDYNLSKFNEWLAEATAVLDAFFGTGKRRNLEGTFADVLNYIQTARTLRPELKLIALDLPSGVDADSGAVDPATPHFDHTVTLGFPKIGLYNLPAAEHAGKISIVDIGLPEQLSAGLKTELLTDSAVKKMLPQRPAVSHKGTFGRVMALVGSINYPGAACLACSASIRTGAGLVTLAIAQSLVRLVAPRVPEITYLPLPESSQGVIPGEGAKIILKQLPQYNVLLAGCGSGQSQSIQELIRTILLDNPLKQSMVVDADGLNCLASLPDWAQRFRTPAVFTPHPAEMARLSGKTVQEIQNNRIETSLQAGRLWNKVIVLKGAYTVVAAPDGRTMVSPFANAGLASAGTGDVLAGTIAGLAAQGLELFEAAVCGVYLHALAAELAKKELGDAGMLASDLLPLLPKSLKQLKEKVF
ncbi:MAG TPA: NAD(P)H-hydrate dehydratase [Dehalococcoidales bacterium]|nr:NAD(P)H-hydrate dehydratase [Dehalococcoidales bacterium]